MRIGLKLWNINTDKYLTLAKKLYSEKVFDYIELYVVPGNAEKLDYWQELDMPYVIHAPHFMHGMNLSKQSHQESNMSLWQETLQYADALNAERIIVHSGVDGDATEAARQIKLFGDSRIVVENKPYKTLPQVDGDRYIGATPEEIGEIMGVSGCGFCLDIGHAVSAANGLGIEPFEQIKQFLKLSPVMIHLSDINATSDMDEHLNYGAGTLNFNKLFGLLPKGLPITIETDKGSKDNLDDFIKDAQFLRSL